MQGGRACAISIHAPLAGSDLMKTAGKHIKRIFQSTLPLRGATLSCSRFHSPFLFQSTLPLRGATLLHNDCRHPRYISIHAPLAGSDWFEFPQPESLANFNPRSPCGERPGLPASTARHINFNPRSPCGERPLHKQFIGDFKDFNPRSPCGERRYFMAD